MHTSLNSCVPSPPAPFINSSAPPGWYSMYAVTLYTLPGKCNQKHLFLINNFLCHWSKGFDIGNGQIFCGQIYFLHKLWVCDYCFYLLSKSKTLTYTYLSKQSRFHTYHSNNILPKFEISNWHSHLFYVMYKHC